MNILRNVARWRISAQQGEPFSRSAAQQAPLPRALATEVAVALSFNGSAQAVMMATPADLEDFAYGFAQTEGLASPDEINNIEIVFEGDSGADVRLWVSAEAETRLAARRRYMAGPVGCGLCGIDSIREALRVIPPLRIGTQHISRREVFAATQALHLHQPLHDHVRAAHCAAFVQGGAISVAREDVGRHNALDKVAGALLRANISPACGALLLTSRVSIDLVQKCAALKCPILISTSAPTAAAAALASTLNLTLMCSAKRDFFDLYSVPERLNED